MWLEHWIYKLPLRLRSLLRRNQVEQELSEELQYHLDQQIEILRARGMPLVDARAAALRQMSGLEQQKERCREARGVNLIEDLISDCRYALRSFRKNPSLAAVIITSLALGIGANTAIFSVINAVSLKMLPVREPEGLVLLNWSAKTWPEGFLSDLEGSSRRDAGGGMSSDSFAFDIFTEVKKQNEVFEQTFAFAANDHHVNVDVNGTAEWATMQAVSGDFFDGLGVSPILGRTILPSDDSPSGSTVAMVSHDFWRKHFGSDTVLSGKTVTVNTTRMTIIGVAPAEFFGVRPGNPTDIYIPLSYYMQEYKRLYPDSELASRDNWWLEIMGRLKPGLSPASATPEIQVIMDRVLRADAKAATNAVIPKIALAPAGRGLNELRERFSTSLLLLMGMVGLVLFIACANVSGLLMARAMARQKEIAVRLSLGASRLRIIRQFLAESVMLSLIGGIAGLMVSDWASSSLVHLLSTRRNPIYLSTGIDLRVMGFTAAVSLLAGVLFGLLPTNAATRMSIAPALKDSATPLCGTGYRFQIGKLLVGAQVALALLLLIASGLLLRTLTRLQRVSLGFDQRALLTFEVNPGLNAYTDEHLIAYYQELQRRLQSLPGVRSATLTQHGPIDSGYTSNSPQIPGYTAPGQQADVYRHMVGSDYFTTLNVPIVLGRPVTEQDTQISPKVLVLNQAAVQKYFHGDNPLGKRLVYGRNGSMGSFEVVGVAKDVKYGKVREDVPPTAYWPYQQSKIISRQMVFLVRTEGNPSAIANSVRQVCFDLDKDVPVVRMQTEEEVIDGSLFLERTFALLSSAFGALALMLACVGLYGTIGYAVTRRIPEIGIRMALGAERERILRMILAEVSMVVIAGIAVGVPASWATARLLSHHLYQLSPHDPLTTAAAVAAILAVTLLAGYLPARRASKVNPIIALRYE
ncbi:MAG TPA: ABC transporter permease [Terriglobales bacterium]|nr:ABC transporter permease [Terriglobales bacterium]